jgi:alpha-N-acetylglucosamine transferase
MLAAIQARKHLDREIADVVVILFNSGPSVDEVFVEICRRNNVIFLVSSTEILQGHTTMYARLFLCELLPANYQRILYIDSDVQISESLNDLIRSELPRNHAFAAVADPMCVLFHEGKVEFPKLLSYFGGLGLRSTPSQPYFNSGVLLINRLEWATVSRDALDFLAKSPTLCLFQDQSALNFAGHGKFTAMSFRWNFPIFFRNCAVERPIQPRIYHFMSRPKPWDGSFPPWNGRFSTPYTRLKSEFPNVQTYSKPMPLPTRMKYLCQQYYKRVHETFSWRYSGRREVILEFNGAAKF